VYLFVLLVLFVFPSEKGYSQTAKIGAEKTVTAWEINEQIVIDGRLDEDVWKNPFIYEFIQRDPDEGKPATEVSNVWVAYDHSSLYVAARLYDNQPDSIIALLTRRDSFSESDWFGVYLDPFYDRRTGYFFGVNPAGSIVDGILFNDSWDDDSWNGIWDYAVERDDHGWIVEMRIPFTQIRFDETEDMKWGINFTRIIQRKNETSYFITVPKVESGFVSHFATLTGLKGIKPKQRIELLPYFRTKASFLLHDADDPFYKGNQFSESFGADIKVGIGSNLTFDATLNPDFGQVEVDPAVVNLSTFETYFQEKRPFFIEGNNIFYFGYGGANSNWGFNWGTPELFYSRRIGRSPQGPVNSNGHIDFPDETRIIGAGKLTGKIGGNWSLGFINATTERTYAGIFEDDILLNREVEPLTNFSVARIQKEFGSARYGLGFMGTTVFRNLKSESLEDNLSSSSLVYGTDGWITLDKNDTYVLTGFVAASRINGTEEYLVKLQRSPLRYFQRPDAENFRIDSSRTSLSGIAGRLALNKQKGNFYVNAAMGTISPGFESNDLGFQFRGDVINSHLVLGYRWFEPDGIFRRKVIDLAHFRNYNYDGDLNDIGYMTFINLNFENYYYLGFRVSYNPESYNPRNTRGGPLTLNPASNSYNASVNSDSRKKVVFSLFGQYGEDRLGSEFKYFETGITWKPNSTINVSFSPFYELNDEAFQWVTNIIDPFSATYGSRYIFAFLNHRTVGGNIRLNWTFTPALSLQLFMQPLLSVGNYGDFKELAEAGTNRTNIYGTGNSSLIYDPAADTYTVDPDGNGPVESFSFNNPDFNFKSLRGNVVLRWEFLPGSVFFLVWTHDKTNFAHPGDFSFGRDFTNLWSTGANNILLAKVSYWIDI
jgi:hypothetical protein